MGELKLILGRNDKIEIQALDGTPVDNFTLKLISQRLSKHVLSLSAHVYLFHIRFDNMYKIGFTSQPLKKRFSQIAAQEGWIEFVCAFPCSSLKQARNLETIMHDLYKKYHVKGEWYKLPEEEISRLKEHSSGIEVIASLLSSWQQETYFDGLDRRFSVLSWCEYEVQQWRRDLEDQR